MRPTQRARPLPKPPAFQISFRSDGSRGTRPPYWARPPTRPPACQLCQTTPVALQRWEGVGPHPDIPCDAYRLQHQPRVDRVRPQRAQRRHQPAGLPARRDLPHPPHFVKLHVDDVAPGGSALPIAWLSLLSTTLQQRQHAILLGGSGNGAHLPPAGLLVMHFLQTDL